MAHLQAALGSDSHPNRLKTDRDGAVKSIVLPFPANSPVLRSRSYQRENPERPRCLGQQKSSVLAGRLLAALHAFHPTGHATVAAHRALATNGVKSAVSVICRSLMFARPRFDHIRVRTSRLGSEAGDDQKCRNRAIRRKKPRLGVLTAKWRILHR